MNELKKEMQSRWNEHADSYDSSEAHGLSNPWAIKRWSGLLEGKQGQTLLDVGCGTGFVSLLAAKAGLKVTGVDWSEGMMGRAKEKAKEENLEITFVCSDTEALPFASDTFQNLTARHVIWTLTDPVSTFREWCRVLQPGGQAIVDYSPRKGELKAHHYRQEVESQLPLNRDVASSVIADMFREAGFSNVQVQENSHIHPKTETEEESIHTIYQFIATK